MNMALCGGTGLIGRALTEFWLKKGHRLLIVTRKLSRKLPWQDQLTYVTWDEVERNSLLLEGLDALVNLAGEALNQRWTARAKQSIIDSRISTVARVAKALHYVRQKPAVIVQASAMAVYGTSRTQPFAKFSPVRSIDFLSDVANKWEDAASILECQRLIKLRISLVLHANKGAFPLMKLPYMVGCGGKIGDGDQWISWIHTLDIVRLIDFIIHHPHISGPVNAASPHPVTQHTFGRTLAQIYHRPHWSTVPPYLLQLALGELSTMLLEGQQLVPQKARDSGFIFMFPTLAKALEDLKNKR